MTISIDVNNNHKTPPSATTLAPESVEELQFLSPATQAIPVTDPNNDWSLSTKELIDALPQAWTRGLFYLLVIFAGIILPWSMLAKVDETGHAKGRLEPKGNTIDLDAPVTGTVAVINVKEGQTVKAGQVLLKLDSELVKAELQQNEQKLQGQLNHFDQLQLLKNQLILAVRTQGQQNQAQELEKMSKVEQAKQNLDALKAAYSSQQAEKKAQVSQARQAIITSEAAHRLAKVTLETAQQKVPRYQMAFDEGILSQDRLVEVLQSEKESRENVDKAASEIVQAQSRLKEQQGSYEKVTHDAQSEMNQALLRLQEQQRSYQSMLHSSKLALLKSEEDLRNVETEMTSVKADIAQSHSQIKSLKLQIQQRIFRSPVNGTIFQLPSSEPGKVFQPGELVAKIAPEGTKLVLKAEMPTPESGFVKQGMPVKLKFDAYPFQDYGVIEGRLEWVSPDSKVKETPQGKVEVFEIKVTFDQTYLKSADRKIVLTPGQTASAEVIVRQRRIIDFIIDPFKKLQEGGLDL